jgi:hypothetical protein
MKKALVLVLLLLPTFSIIEAATAHWTGGKRYAKSASGHDAIDCEYDLSGNRFWREFSLSETSSCPATVEAQ